MIIKILSFLAYFNFFSLADAATIDPNNPSNADPSPFPTTVSQVYTRSPDPWPTGIPTLPDICDMLNPSEECFNALDARAAEPSNRGAYLYFDRNNQCSKEQKEILKIGWWETQDVLQYSRNWPNAGLGPRGDVAGEYWMGPNWSDFQDRIGGNLARASDFVNDPANKRNYITITCADPQKYCGKPQDQKTIGGYAWNKDWLFWTYGYINMCDPYYTLSSIGDKQTEINGYLKRGEAYKARNMDYYKTYAQFLSHEMFHLRSTWYPQPEIHDQWVGNTRWDETPGSPSVRRAYGSFRVHALAKKRISQNGGAEKSSQNADSYAILASNIFWWDLNNIFPGPGDKPKTLTDGTPPVIYMPTIKLGNETTVSINDISSKFDEVFDSYVDDGDDSNSPGETSPPQATPGTPVKPGTELRILPLGDSITWGYRSSDGNGYRLELLDNLSADKVVYAGTQPNGNMKDNLNEGYPGKTIQYISDHMSAALDQGPNLVLLMAGTNDLNPDPKISTEGSDPSQALHRLGNLIDKLVSTLKDAVVLVAQLPGVNDNQQHADNTASFNEQMVSFVQQRIANGQKLALVDMQSIQASPISEAMLLHPFSSQLTRQQGSAIFSNDVHPTDQGYRTMGDIWYSAILQIPADDIMAPSVPEPVAPKPGSNNGAESPGSCPFPSPSRMRDYCAATPIYDNDGVVGDGGGLGPNLFGPVNCVSTPGNGRAICRCTKHDNINAPDGGPSISWDAAYADEIGGDCSGLNLPWTTAVRLADMDGDGDVDYLFVRNDSSVLGFENIGSGDQARVGYHYHQRIAKGVIGHEGVTYDFRHEIQFADLNGDGLADYIWTHPNGRVEAWFQANTGWCNLDNNGFIYQGQIAEGIGKPGYGVRHVDLNGDGRADYVYVAPDGTTIAWRNVYDPTFPGSIRYVNDGEIHGPASVPGAHIEFADVTGKGTPDYLMIEPNGRTTMDFNGGPIHNDNTCNRYFESHGVIATGAGPDTSVLYGDLDGDGRAEYTTIDSGNSAIHAYYARCPDRDAHLWCRDDRPDSGRHSEALLNAIKFCTDNAGKGLAANNRIESIGEHASFTAICTSCQPRDSSISIPLDQDLCIKSMSRILNDCDKASGSVTSGQIEWVYLQY